MEGKEQSLGEVRGSALAGQDTQGEREETRCNDAQGDKQERAYVPMARECERDFSQVSGFDGRCHLEVGGGRPFFPAARPVAGTAKGGSARVSARGMSQGMSKPEPLLPHSTTESTK